MGTNPHKKKVVVKMTILYSIASFTQFIQGQMDRQKNGSGQNYFKAPILSLSLNGLIFTNKMQTLISMAFTLFQKYDTLQLIKFIEAQHKGFI